MVRTTDTKPTAIVLGGTCPHIALINNLRRRGYYTILIDYFENPPAREAAHEHIRESTLDVDTVLEIARNRQAEVVITVCLDHANVTACYVAQRLNLPAPYSYETALAVTNKGLMKEKMIENGIPTSKYIVASRAEDFDAAGLRFPVAVKPADSNGSKGVRRANDYRELGRFFAEAQKFSSSDEVIVEEYKEGREVGVDCFVENGEASVVMTKERRKIVVVEDPIQQIHGCIWPADLSERNMTDMKRIAERIARFFGVDNVPLMMQVIVNGDEIDVIEFAARFGGGESFRIIERSTGFDIIDAAVDSFLGRPVKVEHRPPDAYYADNFIYANPGLFGEIAGGEQLLNNRTVEYIDAYKTRGMEVGHELTSNNRVGVFVVKAEDRNGLFGKITSAIEGLEVYDVQGKPMMRKEIYDG